jgi:hypothetical protein
VADYIEMVTGGRPAYNLSLDKMEKLFERKEICLWNYPLTEIEHIIENDMKVVLVRFPDEYGGYEYRFCEMNNDYYDDNCGDDYDDEED